MSPADVVEQARGIIAEAAGPRGWDDTRESWLTRGARNLGIKPGLAAAIWYRKKRRFYWEEFEALRTRHEAQREKRANHESAYARLEQRAAERAGSTPAAGNEESPRRDGATRGGGGEMPARAGAVDAA